MIRGTAGNSLILFKRLCLVHFVFLALCQFIILLHWQGSFGYFGLIISSLIIGALTITAYNWYRVQNARDILRATWRSIWIFTLSAILQPLFFSDGMLIPFLLLCSITAFVVATSQLKQLPALLLLVFLSASVTLLIDLLVEGSYARLATNSHLFKISAGLIFSASLLCLFLCRQYTPAEKRHKNRSRVNVATQYALTITCILAISIGLVTAFMINPIRKAQLHQVGRTFQTVAENFAQLTGSHLEQQIQKLQMLEQQLPVLKRELLAANLRYPADRDQISKILEARNNRWQTAAPKDPFKLSYLNNSALHALSRFRGHNSLHHSIILLDKYGGLVANLGDAPDRFKFNESYWWQATWNEGLGNIFLGDMKRIDQTPSLRIAIDVVDHSTNEFMGVLSSHYLLRTLLDDIRRFKPDTVDRITMVDEKGTIISGEQGQQGSDFAGQLVITSKIIQGKKKTKAGWTLGKAPDGSAALLGYAEISTAYDVISDPLRQLGWKVVVSGSRSSALYEVTRTTKMVLAVGLAAMALGVLAAITAARVITKPLEKLTETASVMQDGNLKLRASVNGPEEVTSLANAFNQLTERLDRVIRNLKMQANELLKAKAEAEAGTKLKGEFLAKMSHEIRTPLNAILGFAGILYDTIEESEKKHHAEIIRSSGKDLLELINDILDISKIEAGRMEIKTEPLDLRTLFEDLQRIFSISAQEKNISLNLSAAPEVPPYLMLDKTRLRQILFNLIGNAIKFTDHGLVECLARTTPGEKENCWELQFEIKDTGIGIDPANQEKIFEIFKQDRSSTNNSVEGTGLGLTISKSLVEIMGGTIGVKSSSHLEGTNFIIRLPDVEAAEQSSELTERPLQVENRQSIRFEPASILLVDDRDINRQLIKETLKSSPLTIIQAEKGAEALKFLDSHRFHLILLDIMMPDLDGYTTLQMIRKKLGSSMPPVIAITAAGMKEDIARIQDAGFSDHLIRPFSRSSLFYLLKKYLLYRENSDWQEQQAPPQSAGKVIFDPKKEQPWQCPPDARPLVRASLEEALKNVMAKQSVPDIINFAADVAEIGQRFHLDVLSRYGAELRRHAEAFDISGVETMLTMYQETVALGIGPDGIEKEE